MPHKIRSIILLILVDFVLGCNQPEKSNQKRVEATVTDSVLKAKGLPDTVFYDNGKPKTIIVGSSRDFDSKTYEYYSNKQLKRVSEQGTFSGCGIQVGDELNYDSLGNLISKSSFNHHLPKNAMGCHDTRTVIVTTLYYANGKIKLKKNIETCYECEECNCGTWEYYDESGKLTNKENYESCDDDKLDCLQ